MNYPDDFNTPAFPAGKRISVSRLMAIGTSVTLVIIVLLCGMILWAAHSTKMDPFLVSVDPITAVWEIVGHKHNNNFTPGYTLQESVVRNFVVNWFTISDNLDENDARWEMVDTEFCNSDEFRPMSSPNGALACATTPALMEHFVYDIVPQYQDYVANGTKWSVDTNTWTIEPIGKITDNGGTWRILAQINSSTDIPISILAFVNVGYAANGYSNTMGFHITNFNAYKIN